MPKWFVRLALLVMAIIGMAALTIQQTLAAAQDGSAASAGYRFDESVIGGGGLIQSNSASYATNGVVLGDTAVGESNSANFSFGAGNKTTPDPTLAFGILDGNVTFQDFTASRTSVAEATFRVMNYTSYGYSVQVSGPTPSNQGHSIAALDPRDPPQTGVEQFGINLVANASTPTRDSVGKNIDYTAGDVPYSNGPFGKNGHYGADYGTTGEFKYADGDQIAYGSSSSGQTDYTISYVMNVSGSTPGGIYRAAQTLICTGTF